MLDVLFLLLNTGKPCLSTPVFLCFRDTALLQTEGLWQPHIKEVYWYHLPNSIISIISKLRCLYVYRTSPCGTPSRLPENVNITFICTGKPESSCDPFYCSIFVMIWNQGYSISKVKVKSPSRVRLFATPWTVAYQAPPSRGFSRQEYWSGLPFPSPEDLPDPGIKPRSPALKADALTSEPRRKPVFL